MEKYRLYTVVPDLLKFLDNLMNWYIRFNRKRFKGELGDKEAHVSLNILFEVMLNTTLMLASFVPYITETIY